MENKHLVDLARTALTGDVRRVELHLRKLASKFRSDDPELFHDLNSTLESSTLSALRSHDIARPIPVDADSRLQLLKYEDSSFLETDPVHDENIASLLNQFLLERTQVKKLLDEGLLPSKSLLFVGPPGVGKTLSARWIANQLNLPLLVLDLATVMSSFLGKTGTNIRAVLDHAASFPCVLLLDEFDAIAKRRDDDSEVGELKRLVTVLLQAIDDWPESSVLIAASNHGELLDPAIWRRFDLEITFSLPDKNLIEKFIKKRYSELHVNTEYVADLFEGSSFSDVERTLIRSKKESVLWEKDFNLCVMDNLLKSKNLTSASAKKAIAIELHRSGWSQRRIEKEVGLSRPTIKKLIDELT